MEVIEWAWQAGSTAENYSQTVIFDSYDNSVYLGGLTWPNDGGFLGARSDAFVSKYSFNGEVEWVKSVATGGDDKVTDIEVDGNGNIYITGSIDGDFSGQNDGKIFVIKMDSNGNEIWQKTFHELLPWGEGSAINMTSGGDIYLTGFVYGSDNLDVFLKKIDDDGAEQWTIYEGEWNLNADYAVDVKVDENGFIYLLGATLGSVTGEEYQVGSDVFLAKYNHRGERIWLDVFGERGHVYPKALTILDDENIYVAGTTSVQLDGQLLAGGEDGFLSNYSSSGSRRWTELVGSEDSQLTDSNYFQADAYSLAHGVDGLIYVTGKTFNGIDGQNILDAEEHGNGYDAYMAVFDKDGERLRTRLFGSTQMDSAFDIAIAPSGDILIAGGTMGKMAGVQDIDRDMSRTRYDSFLVKLVVPSDDQGAGDAIQDLDADGFVDGSVSYQMWTASGGVDLTNRRGRTYSDNTSRKWDAIKAVESDSGFSVLVEGHLSKEGKYKVVTADDEGVIGKATRWLNGNQMLRSGYEEIFSMDFNGNGVVDLV